MSDSVDSIRMAIHFFVNFDIFKWLYLAYFWVYLHQTWGFCESRCALSDYVNWPIVANPIIYRLVPSPSRFKTRQCCINPKVHCMVYCSLGWFKDGRRTAELNHKLLVFRTSNHFTCHSVWRRSTKVDLRLLIKNHLGRGDFLLFSKLLPHFVEHYVVYKLQQDSCH